MTYIKNGGTKMFVMDKRNGKCYEVYNIRSDKNGYPHFLIYRNNQWEYAKAKHFVPMED